MIMTDTMQNLHTSFIEQNPGIQISYSSFCALRPFCYTNQNLRFGKLVCVSTMKMPHWCLMFWNLPKLCQPANLRRHFNLCVALQLVNLVYCVPAQDVFINLQDCLKSKRKQKWNGSSWHVSKNRQKTEFTFTPDCRNTLVLCQSLWLSTKKN